MEQIREGKITIAPEVLLDIVREAALYTDGVDSLAPIPPRVDRIFRRVVTTQGIELEIKDDSISIDLYLAVRAVNFITLSHKIQKEVIRSMDKLVGLEVDSVNIHIEDVVYPQNGSD